MRKKLIENQLYVNNALIEIKNHVYRHSALKRVEGSLNYGKSKSAICFLKAWSNFVEKINEIRQFLWRYDLDNTYTRFRALDRFCFPDPQALGLK